MIGGLLVNPQNELVSAPVYDPATGTVKAYFQGRELKPDPMADMVRSTVVTNPAAAQAYQSYSALLNQAQPMLTQRIQQAQGQAQAQRQQLTQAYDRARNWLEQVNPNALAQALGQVTGQQAQQYQAIQKERQKLLDNLAQQFQNYQTQRRQYFESQIMPTYQNLLNRAIAAADRATNLYSLRRASPGTAPGLSSAAAAAGARAATQALMPLQQWIAEKGEGLVREQMPMITQLYSQGQANLGMAQANAREIAAANRGDVNAVLNLALRYASLEPEMARQQIVADQSLNETAKNQILDAINQYRQLQLAGLQLRGLGMQDYFYRAYPEFLDNPVLNYYA